MSSLVLAMVIAVEVGWALVLACMLGFALIQQRRRRRIEAAALAIRPAIQEALAILIAGGSNSRDLQQFSLKNRREVERSILAFQAVAGSVSSQRLCDLALELTIVHGWIDEARSKNVEKKRRAFINLCAVAQSEPVMRIATDILELGLKDRDEFVRLSAAKALARSGEIGLVSRAFRAVLAESAKVRMLASPELRLCAAELCRSATDVLASPDTSLKIHALEMLESWSCALPLEGVDHLLKDQDSLVRLRTVQLLPMLPVTPQNRNAIVQALTDQDPEVRTAANVVAERLAVGRHGCPTTSATGDSIRGLRN